jgi:hypothetical protein
VGQQHQRTPEFGCSYLSSHQVHGGTNGGDVRGPLQCAILALADGSIGHQRRFKRKSCISAFPPIPNISVLLLLTSQTKLRIRERLRCPSSALYEFCNRSRRPRQHAQHGGGANGEPVDVIDRAAHGMMSPAAHTNGRRHDKPAGNSHHYRKRVDRRRNCAHKPLGAERRRLAATEPLDRHRCLMRGVPSGHLRTAMPASSPQCATTEIGARMGYPRRKRGFEPRMAESKSNKFHLSLQAHSEKSGGNRPHCRQQLNRGFRMRVCVQQQFWGTFVRGF